MTQTATSAAVTFVGEGRSERDDALRNGPMDLVGYGVQGECWQQFISPAARELQKEGLIARIAGVDPRPLGSAIPCDDYCVNTDLAVPRDWLEAKGYLNAQTVHLVSTPSRWHASTIEQILAGDPDRTHVACEKPLTLEAAEAGSLLRYKVAPISHQLAKTQFREFLRTARAGLLSLHEIGHLDFFLLEDAGVTRARDADDVFFDMISHGQAGIVVPVAILLGPEGTFSVFIDKVLGAKYVDEPKEFAPAPRWSAGAIHGRICCWGAPGLQGSTHEMTYRICAGKGLARPDKRCVVKDRHGKVMRTILLVDQPRWAAHYWLLRQLVLKANPDMLLSLPQAVGVVELCQKSAARVDDLGIYPFGTTPPCLLEELD